jgi:hypothetical protein
MANGPYGIEILGNVLYCCDGNGIKGYNLSNGSMVFNLNLGASFLNGITSDGMQYLFTTDYSAKKIYRVNTLDSTFNLMRTTTKTPNGIIYDGANNRCVFVTWGSAAPVQAMSLSDSTISTVRTTSLSNCDGITRDHEGNWYIVAWGTNSLNKIDSGFTIAPVSVMTGLSSPADLGINSAGDSIAIPNSGSANNVVFYHIISTTGIKNAEEKSAMNVFPNPSSERTTITIDNPIINGTIELTDMNGRIIITKKISGNIFFLNREKLADGNYNAIVKDADGKIVCVRKIIYQ